VRGNKLTWVDDVTKTSAANFNRLEALVQDAVEDSKQLFVPNVDGFPAPSDATKNWLRIDDDTGQAWYCDGFSWLPIGRPGNFRPVLVAATTNVPLARSPVAYITVDGVAVGYGDRVLLTKQTNPSQNGIYSYNPSTGALTRAWDANHSLHFRSGQSVLVRSGTYAGMTFTFIPPLTDLEFVLGLDSVTFVSPRGQVADLTAASDTLHTFAGLDGNADRAYRITIEGQISHNADAQIVARLRGGSSSDASRNIWTEEYIENNDAQTGPQRNSGAVDQGLFLVGSRWSTNNRVLSEAIVQVHSSGSPTHIFNYGIQTTEQNARTLGGRGHGKLFVPRVVSSIEIVLTGGTFTGRITLKPVGLN
jgi:hypothetical protein